MRTVPAILSAFLLTIVISCRAPEPGTAPTSVEPETVPTSAMEKLRPQQVGATHGSGDMAMSPVGEFIAFTVLEMPSNEFALIDLNTKKTWLIEAPAPHNNIGDLAWSPDGDELTFVTAQGYILQGAADHVWRLRMKNGAPEITLLAEIPVVRHPVLSTDGKTLATFEGLIFPDERLVPPYAKVAYAIFERSVMTGQSKRRSIGQFSTPLSLLYDKQNNLSIALMEPQIATKVYFEGRAHYNWTSEAGAEGSGVRWDRDTNSVKSFRIKRDEMLAVWPKPFPSSKLPKGARAVRPLDDGRIVVYGSLEKGSSDYSNWYTPDGRPKKPDRTYRYDFIAYDEKGSAQVLPSAQLPLGAGRSGGADISGNGQRFAQITDTCQSNKCDHGLLRTYDNGKPTLEAPIESLISGAPVVKMALDSEPIIPIESSDFRRALPPSN